MTKALDQGGKTKNLQIVICICHHHRYYDDDNSSSSYSVWSSSWVMIHDILIEWRREEETLDCHQFDFDHVTMVINMVINMTLIISSWSSIWFWPYHHGHLQLCQLCEPVWSSWLSWSSWSSTIMMSATCIAVESCCPAPTLFTAEQETFAYAAIVMMMIMFMIIMMMMMMILNDCHDLDDDDNCDRTRDCQSIQFVGQ